MNRSMWQKFAAFAVVLLLGSVAGVLAQEDTGNVFAEVSDTEGSSLPGVTCELGGMGATRTYVSNAVGELRWISLEPGVWSLRCSLEGFSTVEYPRIEVRAGHNVTLRVQLSAAIGEVITVTSESPLLDERRLQTGTTMTQIELEKIPTARDPWALATQTPGVLSDRVNVAGGQSGQQAGFNAGGVSSDENDFLVDGIQFTDMTASGGSAGYYDYEQFTEIQFGTGGADVTKATAGVAINMITKRGTNEFRGSARFLVTDDDGLLFFDQSESSVSEGQFAPTQTEFSGNKINKIQEWGFEAGGPVVRDRVWLWGSHGVNNIKTFTGGGNADDTILTNTAAKLNVQIVSANSFLASWNAGDKEKFGRSVSISRPPDAAWNQRGPSALMKFEDTHVFSSSFFLTGGYAFVDGGFQLETPLNIRLGKALGEAPQAHLDDNGVWNNYLGGGASRPSEEFKVDGSYFFNTGNTSHELKFGARLREASRATSWVWSNNNAWSIGQGNGLTDALLITQRGDVPDVSQEYTSAWVQDTITMGAWTFNVGFRYDNQEGENAQFESGSNPWFPNFHPNVSFPGSSGGFAWEDISPRLGVTYALGEERKTLLRASFSQFPEQLDTGGIARINPAGESYITMFWTDTDGSGDYNGNRNLGFGVPGPDEVEIIGYSGWDPDDPVSLNNPNITDPGYDAEMTTEGQLAVEHALMPEFVVGASFVYRLTDRISETRDIIFLTDGGPERTATTDDYVRDGRTSGLLPDGSPYSTQIWALNPIFSENGGSLLMDGSREQEFMGVGVNFNKRLSNQWMLRGYFNYGDSEWNVPEEYLFNNDPNRLPFGEDCDGCRGGEQSGGSGAFQNVFLHSTWSYNLAGMYQFAPDRPWGFNVAGNIFGRQAFPMPYFADNITASDGNTRDLAVWQGDNDQFRSDDVLTVDLRLDKEFAASGGVGFTVGADLFNVFNEAYTLQRDLRANLGNYDYLFETLSPRIWRLTARISFR